MVWGGLAAIILAITGALAVSRLKPASPALPVLGPVADFAFTNQDSQPVSLADLRGHVWVADIIFTRCPGPCLRMTQQMKELQAALPASSNARLVSFTTDAGFDTPPVLKKYAGRFGADPERWMFLTGNKTNIANLAIDSLKLTVVEKKPEERTSPNDLFVHSTIFVIIDQQGQLRGVYETGGEDVDWQKSKAELLAAVRQLEHNP